MTGLIGINGKYYQLKDNCKICKKIKDDPPELWSLCTKCGHLYYIKSGYRHVQCKCNHEINFYSRKKEYGWASNFWRSKQRIQEPNSLGFYEVETNEHYYQSQKANDVYTQIWIRQAPTPYLAMMAGRNLRPHEIVDDWETKKVEVMLEGLRFKFKNPELRELLLNTGDAILMEDSPTDMFWGKKGKNMLGKLLMQVRDEIRKEI